MIHCAQRDGSFGCTNLVSLASLQICCCSSACTAFDSWDGLPPALFADEIQGGEAWEESALKHTWMYVSRQASRLMSLCVWIALIDMNQ
jgi:hypothetical protein